MTHPSPALRDASLDDKYAATDQPCLLSGPQALVRMLLTQKRHDKARGLNTAGFVSGYRGSPLGYVDQTLWDAQKWLDQERIVFQPGINEDLAATAVWGTQQLNAVKNATVDGVFSLWYGKGPGVDRSGDAFKHGNFSGTHPCGGVLVLLGDDHPGKSSTVAHHSEQAMVGHQMPVLYPAHVGEYVRFGLWGWALSRYAGCWSAFKVVNETIEQTATVAGEPDLQLIEPDKGDLPPEGLYYRGVYTVARDEVIHKRYRLPLAQKFCRANGIDRQVFATSAKVLGIVTAGKAYGDVMQALRYLGIDRDRAVELGLDVYKVGMIWPLEPQGLREFAASCQELFFIEEKSAFMEPQATALLYNAPDRPVVVGKQDEKGRVLLPSDHQLEPLALAEAIAARLDRLGRLDAQARQSLLAIQTLRTSSTVISAAAAKRIPYFCSGCPHNTSTNVPEGSLAMSGIGCHGMAMWAKPGFTILGTHMGAEGVTWASLQHFSATPHIFQNLGDGTYYHSGLLAIRQSIAARSNITYKILYNDAVAMTGGQSVDGPLTPLDIVRQTLAEGVKQVLVVAEEPQKYRHLPLPDGVQVFPRQELDVVQRRLREVPGCTVLIYDQVCAAEKRRRRKRKLMEDPPMRLFINPEVCEGCGDCSVKSNCVSIEPLDTPLGRKRQINQSTCNKDTSCAQGFCPSFVTLENVTPRRMKSMDLDSKIAASLPDPSPAPIGPVGAGVMLCGIGGTGVVTAGSVMAMAAHLQGLESSAYDMTGISQKNGAVLSHVRFGAHQSGPIPTQSIGLGEAQVVIAFDLVAALSDEALRTLSARSQVLANLHMQPTAAFAASQEERLNASELGQAIEARVGCDSVTYLDATEVASLLCGDAIGTNFFMIGVALQKGWLPLRADALVRAIELNGVQVRLNLNALNLGRLWVHDQAKLMEMVASRRPILQIEANGFEAIVEDRAARLRAYQNQAYAERYLATVHALRRAEAAVVGLKTELSEVVARVLFALMAYKDEYEVARLHADERFHRAIRTAFEGTPSLKFHLAPPLLARRNPITGEPQKRTFGPWILPIFKALSRLKFLRGSLFDPFGHTGERRTERQLIVKYEAVLAEISGGLHAQNYQAATEWAASFEAIRGYGHVKEKNIAKVMAMQDKLRRQAQSSSARPAKTIPIAVEAPTA